MTKILMIAAAFATITAVSGSALAAYGAGHGRQFTNYKLLPYTYNPSRNKSVRDGGSRHGNYYN